MRYLLLLSLVIASSPAAAALDESRVLVKLAQQCTALDDGADRLRCFDEVFGPTTVADGSADAVSTTPECDSYIATLRQEHDAPGSVSARDLDAATDGYIACLR